MERIAESLHRAAAGTGGLVVIEGDAGVGKTELLRTALQHARAKDMCALSGHGVELEREYAFGVARQVFSPLLRLGDGVDDRFDGPAGLVLPLLAGTPIPSGADGEFPYLHGFFWLVANLSESAPIVVAIDDAQWSDMPSLRAMLYLLQRLEELHVCLVVAIRDGEPASPVRLLSELRAHPRACVLRPAPLSREGVEAIVRKQLGGADPMFVDTCAELTGGNPFLLGELLAAVQADGVPATDSGAQRMRELLPSRVLDATMLRLTRLRPEAGALARALAVLGGRGELRIAAALADLDADTAAAAADALIAAGLVREGLTFAHPLLRSAVYSSIGSSERAHMHAAAARILSAAAKAEAVVAAQLLVAERAADPWAVETLRSAAHGALAQGAPGSAGRYLRRALEEPPAAELRGDVLADLATAELAAGDARGADDVRSALELIDDLARRVTLRIALADSLHHHGRQLEAAAVLDEGIAELAGRHGELPLELEAAFIGIARLEPSLRVRAMPRLAELTRGMRGETPIERQLLAHEANRRVFAGEPHTEVRELVRLAWAGGALLDDRRGGGLAPITAVIALGWCDDFDAYEDDLHAMQADARRRGLVLRHADATYGLHLAHHFRGRLADAIADVETALDARRHGWRAHLATATSQLVWTLIELDELDRAERALDDPDIEAVRGRLPYALVHDARGRLAVARGDARRAFEEFLAAGQIAETAPLANPSYLPWRSSAALAASRLGDREFARELIAEELRRAERFGAPRPRGIALRAAGLIQAGDKGIDLLRAAVEQLEASPAALEHARALTDLGAALRRRGQRRDARAPLRAGLELAIGLGAKAIERRAHDELVAAGARPRRRQFSGVDALTPGERRVAHMAADGMSNREIAESLFVTVKAVQWHLGNAYRKVGVSSRHELGGVLGGAPH